MNDYSASKYRYFLLSFSLSFLVLSLMLLTLMNAVHPNKAQTPAVKQNLAEQAYSPAPGDALSVLFIGTGTDETVAGTFILARFDPARGKVPVIVFPPQTGVENSGKTESLAEVYRYGGADYTRNTLAEAIGTPIDRYVRVRIDSFITGAAAIGSVEFDLKQPVTVTRGGASVSFSQGKQLLDGQNAADIIRYGGYPGGELERCRITGELAAAIIDQRRDICRSTVVDNVFEKLINIVNTDISYPDYYERKEAAEYISRLSGDIAVPIAVSGSWNSDRQLYMLSDTFLALISQTLR